MSRCPTISTIYFQGKGVAEYACIRIAGRNEVSKAHRKQKYQVQQYLHFQTQAPPFYDLEVRVILNEVETMFPSAATYNNQNMFTTTRCRYSTFFLYGSNSGSGMNEWVGTFVPHT